MSSRRPRKEVRFLNDVVECLFAQRSFPSRRRVRFFDFFLQLFFQLELAHPYRFLSLFFCTIFDAQKTVDVVIVVVLVIFLPPAAVEVEVTRREEEGVFVLAGPPRTSTRWSPRFRPCAAVAVGGYFANTGGSLGLSLGAIGGAVSLPFVLLCFVVTCSLLRRWWWRW